MKKLISFDLDQTLVETARAHSLSFAYAFEKQGIKIKEKTIWPFLDGRHSREVVLSIAKKIKVKLNEKQINGIREFHHFYLKETTRYIKPIPRAYEILKELKKSYTLALLTNCAKEEAFLLLKFSGINKKIFNIIVLADQVKHPKPWPDEIFKAEKILHVKSDIHIGDSVYDVIAAKKAKAISIAVLSGQSTREQLEKLNPDFIIENIRELPRTLKRIENSL